MREFREGLRKGQFSEFCTMDWAGGDTHMAGGVKACIMNTQ